MYELETMNGICRYCGQLIMVKAVSQDNADEQAAEKCNCKGANRARKIRDAYHQLHAVTGDESVAYGFRTTEPDVENQADELMKLIIDHRIIGYQLDLEDSVLKVKEGPNGINITRTKKKTITTKV